MYLINHYLQYLSIKNKLNVDNYWTFEETGNNQVYKASRAAVNSATIDFDIDGIATIQWSGFARTLEDYSLANSPADSITANYTEAITGTSNFIRNRLTDITLVRNDVSPEDCKQFFILDEDEITIWLFIFTFFFEMIDCNLFLEIELTFSFKNHYI